MLAVVVVLEGPDESAEETAAEAVMISARVSRKDDPAPTVSPDARSARAEIIGKINVSEADISVICAYQLAVTDA